MFLAHSAGFGSPSRRAGFPAPRVGQAGRILPQQAGRQDAMMVRRLAMMVRRLTMMVRRLTRMVRRLAMMARRLTMMVRRISEAEGWKTPCASTPGRPK